MSAVIPEVETHRKNWQQIQDRRLYDTPTTTELSNVATLWPISGDILHSINALLAVAIQGERVDRSLFAPIVLLLHSFLDTHINTCIATKVVEAKHTPEEMEFFEKIRRLSLTSNDNEKRNKLKLIVHYLFGNKIIPDDRGELMGHIDTLCDLRDIIHHFEEDYRPAGTQNRTLAKLAKVIGVSLEGRSDWTAISSSVQAFEAILFLFSKVLYALHGHFTDVTLIEEQVRYHLTKNTYQRVTFPSVVATICNPR